MGAQNLIKNYVVEFKPNFCCRHFLKSLNIVEKPRKFFL